MRPVSEAFMIASPIPRGELQRTRDGPRPREFNRTSFGDQLYEYVTVKRIFDPGIV